MTREEVIAKLGEPNSEFTFGRRNQRRTVMTYGDGTTDYSYILKDGELAEVNRRERHSLNSDTLIFATTFQFFYLRLAIFFGCVGDFRRTCFAGR